MRVINLAALFTIEKKLREVHATWHSFYGHKPDREHTFIFYKKPKTVYDYILILIMFQ